MSSEDELIPHVEKIPINDDTFTKIFNKKSTEDEANVDSLNNVVHELGIISLSWPDVSEPEFEGRTCFPESYYKNSNKEKLVLTYAENFRQQFNLKFPDRQPLLLQARNECGIQVGVLLNFIILNIIWLLTLVFLIFRKWFVLH